MATRSPFSIQSFFRRQESLFAGLRGTAVLACVASLVLLMAALPTSAADTPTAHTLSYARIVRLSYVEGDVEIVRADKSSKWESATMNMPIEQGFAVGTNVGRAEVEFENGSMLWLAPNSVVQFTELALSNGGRVTRVTLSEGIASFDASLTPGETFEVATPNFSVTPSKNAEFKVGIRGKSAGVTVTNGKVLVGDHGWTQDVSKGTMFFDQSGKTPKTAMARSPKPDQWDRWVSDRLTAERHGATEAMVDANAPFSYGMSDLADYGSWNYYPGFGYGWQPFGMMAGWAPFMDGNWMYYPTFGWTWLSAEPWGWVPYHFGGWQYSPVYGWMWFPGNYGTWTAAPVQWLGVGKHIGWVPRGVNVPRAGAVGSPVVVGAGRLGSDDRNKVFTANEVSAKMQKLNIRAINFEPAENGKVVPMTAMRPRVASVIVPTSASLQALRAHLAVNPSTRIDINSLHQAAISRTPIQGIPERGFAPINAAMAAPRMPSRPPMHAAFGPADTTEPYSAGRAGMMPGTATSPAMPPSMPATSARPTTSTTTSAPGRPR